jgi:hypothetical protein
MAGQRRDAACMKRPRSWPRHRGGARPTPRSCRSCNRRDRFHPRLVPHPGAPDRVPSSAPRCDHGWERYRGGSPRRSARPPVRRGEDRVATPKHDQGGMVELEVVEKVSAGGASLGPWPAAPTVAPLACTPRRRGAAHHPFVAPCSSECPPHGPQSLPAVSTRRSHYSGIHATVTPAVQRLCQTPGPWPCAPSATPRHRARPRCRRPTR